MLPDGLRRWLGGGLTGVKICGITRREDALNAVAAGADALGFNFYAKSKRAVRLGEISEWVAELPPDVGRVAVVVNPGEEIVRELLASGIFHALQFHGSEPPEFCARWGGEFYVKAKALRGGVAADVVFADPPPCLLLDAHAPGEFGGTGRVIDWGLAAEVVRGAGRPVALSGGLDPRNVAEAVRRVRPAAVDAASGVERAPGVKDAAMMRDFVAAARGA